VLGRNREEIRHRHGTEKEKCAYQTLVYYDFLLAKYGYDGQQLLCAGYCDTSLISLGQAGTKVFPIALEKGRHFLSPAETLIPYEEQELCKIGRKETCRVVCRSCRRRGQAEQCSDANSSKQEVRRPHASKAETVPRTDIACAAPLSLIGFVAARSLWLDCN
jgi:hypothetical protein